MEFVRNFPFISIILSLFSGRSPASCNRKAAKWWNMAVIGLIGIMSVAVLGYVLETGEAYVYTMGHFTAPWGNEIRVGILEAFMAAFFLRGDVPVYAGRDPGAGSGESRRASRIFTM